MTRKFLVPLILPADPTAAMQAATKQYVDGKVGGPPAGSTFVVTPAEAGSRADATTQARFGNINETSKIVGYIADPGGDNLIISRNGGFLTLYERDTVGGYRPHASFTYGDSAVYPWRLTTLPHTGACLTRWELNGQNDYSLLSLGNDLMLNAVGTGHFRVANNEIMAWDGSTISPYRRIYSRFYIGASAWDTSHISVIGLQSDGTNGARISIHSEYAGCHQLRCSIHESGIASLDWSGTAYQPYVANSFVTGSSVKTKKAVREARTIGLERERIVVRQDPRSDTVPDDLDIMALRPVAFRPKQPASHPVKNEDGEWEGGEDWPLDSWWGHEGHRERLGLVAEDVETVIPSAVSHGLEGNVVGIDYAQVTVALLAHVQRMTEEMATMRYRITELEAMVQ